MNKLLASVVVVGSLLGGVAGPAAVVLADYPKPSLYPVSWELKFTHAAPKRIVVDLPGGPKAYWYITYQVTNPTDREVTFLPLFEMLTPDGNVVRSDNNIPGKVLDIIRNREGNSSILSQAQIGGTLRIGEDQAKDGVAVWEEIPGRPGHFSIFVQGLSGESATVKGPDNKNIILRKTLQLNYLIRGDEIYPGEDEVNENPSRWIMR